MGETSLNVYNRLCNLDGWKYRSFLLISANLEWWIWCSGQFLIQMSYWRHMMLDVAKISYQRLAFLSICSHWQLIQNLAPSTIVCVWHQCDIRILLRPFLLNYVQFHRIVHWILEITRGIGHFRIRTFSHLVGSSQKIWSVFLVLGIYSFGYNRLQSLRIYHLNCRIGRNLDPNFG